MRKRENLRVTGVFRGSGGVAMDVQQGDMVGVGV